MLDQQALLLVAAAPDAVIQMKGRNPRWTHIARANAVANITGVDGVIVQRELTPAHLIRTLKPRYFVKGPDWRGRLPADVIAACDAVGTEMVYTDTEDVHGSETVQ